MVVNAGDSGLIRVVKPVYLDKEFVVKFGSSIPFPEGGFNDGDPLGQGIYQVSDLIGDRVYGPDEEPPDSRSESEERRSTVWKISGTFLRFLGINPPDLPADHSQRIELTLPCDVLEFVQSDEEYIRMEEAVLAW